MKELADVTGLTIQQFKIRAMNEQWPDDAKIWCDDDHVYVYESDETQIANGEL